MTAPAALERLAAALGPGFSITLVRRAGRRPRLTVADRHTRAATEAYNTYTQVPVTARTHAQVTALFGGLPLLAPGVVPITQWRPPVGDLPYPADLYAGVAHIPYPVTRMGGLA